MEQKPKFDGGVTTERSLAREAEYHWRIRRTIARKLQHGTPCAYQRQQQQQQQQQAVNPFPVVSGLNVRQASRQASKQVTRLASSPG
ncbi:hypothetical protein M0802_006785 [Mischocyttarus mexicanus]|nr:hypothetical protein M0802_006785 [Mischocyttarus mexicanus]